MGVLSKFRREVETDALVLAQRLGQDVRDFFSTLLEDLQQSSSHATTAVAESDALIASANERKAAAQAVVDANAKLVNGLKTLGA